LGYGQAGIVSDDDDLGGLEDLAKGANELALCRAIHQLSPVGGPLPETAGLMPAVPPFLKRKEAARTTLYTLPPEASLLRAIEVRTQGQYSCPGSSPVYAGFAD
jgi:hypothetical protein